MHITLKIERTMASKPSFDPPGNQDLEEEFVIDSAKVILDHGESPQLMEEPPIKFIIEDNEGDIETKYHFLEWANCYWNENQRQGGRLRKVTLNYFNDSDECYRSFVIENAFLAVYEEYSGQKGATHKYCKATIRSNAKKQNIDFLPHAKEEK